MLPIGQETRRTAADYGAEAFFVIFTREVDGEETEFPSVAEIVGSECVWLRVAPFFGKPGGLVYLPAGSLEWRCRRPGYSAWLPLDSFRTKDHPAFRHGGWLKAQQDCAYTVARLNRAGNFYYINPFWPGPPYAGPG